MTTTERTRQKAPPPPPPAPAPPTPQRQRPSAPPIHLTNRWCSVDGCPGRPTGYVRLSLLHAAAGGSQSELHPAAGGSQGAVLLPLAAGGSQSELLQSLPPARPTITRETYFFCARHHTEVTTAVRYPFRDVDVGL